MSALRHKQTQVSSTALHLRETEREAIRPGQRELRRPVRRRKKGRRLPFNCSVKRGQVADVDGVVVRVREVRQIDATEDHPGEWLIKLEDAESWAVPKRAEPAPVTGPLSDDHRKQVLAFATHLEFPDPCPVSKGDVIEVIEDVEVLIGQAIPVRGKAAHKVKITVRDFRPEHLLRRSLPATNTGRMKAMTKAEREAARLDGAYTDRPELSLGGDDRGSRTGSAANLHGDNQSAQDPGESVPPGWEDKGVAERVTRMKEAQSEAERAKREADARAKIGRTLKGLNPAQSIALLAYIEKGCQMAESGELDEAA